MLPCLPEANAVFHVPLYRAQTRAEMSAMLAACDDAPRHLVAFSMGGYLALEYALSHPGEVASLVLIGTSARGLQMRERVARQATLAWLAEHDYQGMSRQRLAMFVHPSHRACAGIVDVVREMDRSLGKATLMVQLRETSDRADLLGGLHNITCPVLVTGGEEDALVSVEDLTAIAQAIPQARLQIMPGSGHMLPLEQPVLLASAVAAFWETVPQ